MKNKIAQDELDWKEGKVKGFFGKELFSEGNGALKVIKIAPRANYPEHIHPDKMEYVYVLEGRPSFLIGSEKYSSEKGLFFTFPVNTKHAIMNETDEECQLLVGAVKQ